MKRTTIALLILALAGAGIRGQTPEEARPAQSPAPAPAPAPAPVAAAPAAGGPTIETTRLAMAKWIEIQQIISKEKKDWQQGREINLGRREIVAQEVAILEEKIKQAASNVTEAENKKNDLLKENDALKATSAKLATAVAALEASVHRLFSQLPEPVKTRLQPLYQRIPQDPATTRASVAERYQNVIGILNDVNKSNNEITVNYEVHELPNGKPSEVRAIYAGLAQAWFVSPGGEASVGRPTPEGWKWQPSKAVAGDVLIALDILQGKHSPVYVPLPVKIQ